MCHKILTVLESISHDYLEDEVCDVFFEYSVNISYFNIKSYHHVTKRYSAQKIIPKFPKEKIDLSNNTDKSKNKTGKQTKNQKKQRH